MMYSGQEHAIAYVVSDGTVLCVALHRMNTAGGMVDATSFGGEHRSYIPTGHISVELEGLLLEEAKGMSYKTAVSSGVVSPPTVEDIRQLFPELLIIQPVDERNYEVVE